LEPPQLFPFTLGAKKIVQQPHADLVGLSVFLFLVSLFSISVCPYVPLSLSFLISTVEILRLRSVREIEEENK
jgi:hypothetical protein